jgi:hypothetical protein
MLMDTVKYAPSVRAFHFPPMLRGTDMGPLVVHVGVNMPTNLILIALGSGSVSEFGSFSVLVKNQDGDPGAIATAFPGIVATINLNCQGSIMPPLALPTGLVVAPSTVFAGMSLGDIVASTIALMADMAVSFGLNKLNNAISRSALGQRLAPTLGGLFLGMFFVGSPVGYSNTVSIGSLYGKIRDAYLGDIASGVDGAAGQTGKDAVDFAGRVPNAAIDYFLGGSSI